MIVHLTNSTVAGAAAMLSAAQRSSGAKSLCVQLSDIKPERLVFSPDILPLDATNNDNFDTLRELLSIARIVQVHNWLPSVIENMVLEAVTKTGAQLIWHLHQGQLEHPVYRADAPEIGWHKKLVVAHAFARSYDDFIAVPNCIFRPAVEMLGQRSATYVPSKNKPLRVLFSPSSKTNTRWGAKSDDEFNRVLDALISIPFVEMTEAVGVNPTVLLAMRRYHDVSIDEVVTGGFHLVSYEGLMSGNVVINNADALSMEIFRTALKAPDYPPFVVANHDTIIETLFELQQNREKLAKIQTLGRDYFNTHMRWEKVVKIFDEIYAE